MKISFHDLAVPESGALVVLADPSGALGPFAQEVDRILDGALSRALEASRFTGKRGDCIEVSAPGNGLSRVLLAGIGSDEEMSGPDAETLGGRIMARLLRGPDKTVSAAVDIELGPDDDRAARIAMGALLRSYRFDKYLTKQPEDEKPRIEELKVLTKEADVAEHAWKTLGPVAEGVFLTRDLVTEPANILSPEEFANRARELEKLGVIVEVLGEKDMAKHGMGALLGVGQGSEQESQLAVMIWPGKSGGNGAKRPRRKVPELKDPLAFIGKGVVFDTGGICIKPAPGMEEMKWDMGGAGIVTGLMHALAAREAKVDAVGVIGLVENMPDGKAQRPGDVVTSMSGQTIEVINTDAEGRLVLADALWYTQDRFKPKFMIDLATLTGAIIITFGHEYAGMFTNSDELAGQLQAAGKAVGEGIWRQPIGDEYDKLIKSDIADMKNVGPRGAGSITAAQFLQRFTNDVPWCHIDVAGTVWRNEARDLHEKGATGFGVRLLDRLVADHYESPAAEKKAGKDDGKSVVL